MAQDRLPSHDKVDANTSVNGHLDNLHKATVVINVKSLLVENNLTLLFNMRKLLVSISFPSLTYVS